MFIFLSHKYRRINLYSQLRLPRREMFSYPMVDQTLGMMCKNHLLAILSQLEDISNKQSWFNGAIFGISENIFLAFKMRVRN